MAAAIAMTAVGAVLNAAAFTGGNILAKALSGDGGKAALKEKKRYDAAMEKLARNKQRYLEQRNAMKGWVEQQDREKYQADKDFSDLDSAFDEYTNHTETRL